MDFRKLAEYLDTLPEAGVPSCDMVIYQDHKPIFRHMAGFRDEEHTQPLRGDETYCLYSCSKLVTSCAGLQLVEKGLLRLDDPVSLYLPAYEKLTVRSEKGEVPAKNTMTIRHLFSMQSGLNYELKAPVILDLLERTKGYATTREIADALAAQPLEFEPGTDFLYSLSHDVLGAVVEVVSRKSFGDYLKENIFDPLGLGTIGFRMKAPDRQCAQYRCREEDGRIVPITKDVADHRLSERHESGGAGLISDIRDYITFADAMACGGVGEQGAAILKPETIQIWSANQLVGKARKSFDEWNRQGYSYALGVRTRVDLSKGGSGAIGEFGWDGAAGSWTMVDPVLHLSAFYAMHVKNFGYSYDVIHPTLRKMIYEGL
ncbi:MAG: beta-lactamase family protein [Blautia sp.]|nr:beta-lactamase family protein [Blautia sp.]